MTRPVRIGLLGCGTVGRGLLELLDRNGCLIEERTGLALEVVKVLVRDPRKDRPGVARSLLTTSAEEVVHGPCDVVVEVLGGVEPARSYVLQALEERKHVVTANKALLAAAGSDLRRFAALQGARLGFEASVAAAIPIVRALEEGLVANRVSELVGILNGTSNFILTRMTEAGETFERALALAQARGFAEADPSLDVDGHDAAQKLAILAGLAFGSAPGPVTVEGIRDLDPEDVRAAEELGYVLKPVAFARSGGELRVHPALLPRAHPLASVRLEDNGVLVRTDAAGELLFRGKGAGALPTASALLADVVAVSRERPEPSVPGSAGPGGPRGAEPAIGESAGPGGSCTASPQRRGACIPRAEQGGLRGAEPPANGAGGLRGAEPPANGEDDPRTRYYLRFPVYDVPGVIGRIATALGRHEISISHAEATLAPERPGQGHVKILAHDTKDGALRGALDDIARLPVLTGRSVAVRILA